MNALRGLAVTICLSAALWLALAAPTGASHPQDGSKVYLPHIGDSSETWPVFTEALESAMHGALAPALSDCGLAGPSYALHSFRVAGAYAFALAVAIGRDERREVVVLAREDQALGWEAVTSCSRPGAFHAMLDEMPPELLDAGDRAFLRQYVPDLNSLERDYAEPVRDHLLPWPGDEIGYVTYMDGPGHDRQVDFDILGYAAAGRVMASKPGVVVFAKDSSALGCSSLACWQQANMVVVQHGPDEYSWYVHLAPGSVPVRAGDRVNYGAEIGTEGRTGFATGVHLHYMVSGGHTAWTQPEDPNRAPWALDIRESSFVEVAGSSLTVGAAYTSQNGAGGTCAARPLVADQVALYDHAGFCGIYSVADLGSYPTAASFDFYNDRASSIAVGDEVTAIVCQHEEFDGVCEELTDDVANLTETKLGNDQASSLKVVARKKVATLDVPVPRFPLDGALEMTSTVSLEWMKTTSAITYQVQTAIDASFAVSLTDVLTTSTQITVHLTPDTKYVWRVRATNGEELWSEWSRPRILYVMTRPQSLTWLPAMTTRRIKSGVR